MHLLLRSTTENTTTTTTPPPDLRRFYTMFRTHSRPSHPQPVRQHQPPTPPIPPRRKRHRTRSASTPQVHFTPETLERERQKTRKESLAERFRVSALFAQDGGWERERAPPPQRQHHHPYHHRPEPWPQSVYYLGSQEERPMFLRRHDSRFEAEEAWEWPRDQTRRQHHHHNRQPLPEGRGLRRVKSFFHAR